MRMLVQSSSNYRINLVMKAMAVIFKIESSSLFSNSNINFNNSNSDSKIQVQLVDNKINSNNNYHWLR